MIPVIIQIENLSKIYGSTTVVSVPNLYIKAGESIGLVGNNGAGKTTLFRMMLDLVRTDTGHILLDNEDVAKGERWKDFTAAYLDEGFLIDYLTPEEYFYFAGSLHQLSHQQVDEFLLTMTDFFSDEILKQGKYIRDLSKGNQFKVGVAACLLQKPRVILLDEPFANIDPTTQIRLKSLLKTLHKEQGLTMLISSHDLNHITDLCDRILLMEKGHIIKDMVTSPATQTQLEQYFAVGGH